MNESDSLVGRIEVEFVVNRGNYQSLKIRWSKEFLLSESTHEIETDSLAERLREHIQNRIRNMN